MKLVESFLNEVKVFSLSKFEDNRGFFLEKYHIERYSSFGINDIFVQDNQSRSNKDVIRGLHFTINNPQSQLMTVMSGEVFDVVVDVRVGSKTFGQHKSFILSDKGPQQIYMSNGFAHGFCVLSDTADLHYKVSKFYNHDDEFGIAWDDKDINIKWPCINPEISPRDLLHPSLNEYEKNTIKSDE
jgi:dTDP-4-dehydrorhamnose 3,5-epimerase